MRWGHRRARKQEVFKAKTIGKLEVSSAKYGGNKKKAVRVNTIKNVLGTTAKTAALVTIGYGLVKTAINSNKLIRVTGSDPELNKKVHAGITAALGVIGTASLYKSVKTIKTGADRQRIINDYSKKK